MMKPNTPPSSSSTRENATLREIAEQLGIPAKTLQNYVSRYRADFPTAIGRGLYPITATIVAYQHLLAAGHRRKIERARANFRSRTDHGAAIALRESAQMIAHLRDDLEMARRELASKDARIARLESDAIGARSQGERAEELSHELQAERRAHHAALTKLQAAEREGRRHDEEMANLREHLANSKNRVQSMTESLAAANSHLAELRATRAAVEVTVANDNQVTAKLRQDLAVTQTDLARHKQQVFQLQTDADRLLDQLSIVQSRIMLASGDRDRFRILADFIERLQQRLAQWSERADSPGN